MMPGRLLAVFSLALLLLSCAESSESGNGKGAIPGEGEPQSKKTRRAAASKKNADFPSLSLDFLFDKKPAAGGAESERNIVSMEEDPVVVAERKRKEEEERKKAEEAAKKAAEARKIADEEIAKNPPPPQPPPIQFEFIGYMGPAGGHIGVFRMLGGKEETLLLKRKGDMIDQEFKILEVGYETAEIGFEGFAETKTIPLVAGGK